MSILVINPNSTESITDGLRAALGPLRPAHVHLSFFTAPSSAPTGISNFVTAVQTAAICFDALLAEGAFDKYDGFLVCCFSDHPLQHMIREHLGPSSSKLCISIFEAGLSQALMLSRKFGVLSTGFGPKPLLAKGVSAFLGSSGSDRWAGAVTSGIKIENLRLESMQTEVEALIKATAVKVATLGADCIVLGCAGMTGMEQWVRDGVSEAGLGEVRVIDPAVAGLAFLSGLLHG